MLFVIDTLYIYNISVAQTTRNINDDVVSDLNIWKRGKISDNLGDLQNKSKKLSLWLPQHCKYHSK